jgi:hypothetical protein
VRRPRSLRSVGGRLGARTIGDVQPPERDVRRLTGEALTEATGRRTALVDQPDVPAGTGSRGAHGDQGPVREGAAGGPDAQLAGVRSATSRATASVSTSSRLQKANRTSGRPSSGSAQNTDTGTAATPTRSGRLQQNSAPSS